MLIRTESARRCLGSFLLAAAVTVATSAGADQASPRGNQVGSLKPAPDSLDGIVQLFESGTSDQAVLDRIQARLKATPASLETVAMRFIKAEVEYRMFRRETAIETFAGALKQLEGLTNNVTRRRFVSAYLRFAEILREQLQLDSAIATVEDALRLAPQSMEGQIFLGSLFEEDGQSGRAVTHYKSQLASSVPVAEERAVLTIKLERLSRSDAPSSSARAEVPPHLIHRGLSIGVVPLNDVPAMVDLGDVCLILEASWRVRCEVLPAAVVPDRNVWEAGRNQYQADELIAEIGRRFPRASRRHSYMLGITGRDIFAPQTNFVFSWQSRNSQEGDGVLSTSRFVAQIPDYYEPRIIATRRIAIQALSSTGSMLGFTRPIDPECPLAYPESLREFQFKRLRLCASEEEQRDSLLQRRGGRAEPTGTERAETVSRVLEKYVLEPVSGQR